MFLIVRICSQFQFLVYNVNLALNLDQYLNTIHNLMRQCFVSPPQSFWLAIKRQSAIRKPSNEEEILLISTN